MPEYLYADKGRIPHGARQAGFEGKTSPESVTVLGGSRHFGGRRRRIGDGADREFGAARSSHLKIGDKYFGKKELRTSHQQWIAEAPLLVVV